MADEKKDNQGEAGAGGLRAHPIVERLVRDPNVAAEPTIKLCGYIGRSAQAEHVRLYPTLDDLSTYLEIRQSDVLHSEEVPDSVMEHGGTYLWVKQSAEITHGQTQTTKIQAQFLGGNIADQYLGVAEPYDPSQPLQAIYTRVTCIRTICGLVTCALRTCFVTCATIVRTCRTCITRCATCYVQCWRTIAQPTCFRTCNPILCGVIETIRGCQSVFECPTFGACPSIQCGGGGFDFGGGGGGGF